MGMALDEPRDDDHKETAHSLDFYIAPRDLEWVKNLGGVAVEYEKGMGFWVRHINKSAGC